LPAEAEIYFFRDRFFSELLRCCLTRRQPFRRFRRLIVFFTTRKPFFPALLSFEAPLRARLPAFLANFLTVARFLAPRLPDSKYAPAANATTTPNFFIPERFLVAMTMF